jgi:alpha-beta hydrolase superfamily lysophospholipase
MTTRFAVKDELLDAQVLRTAGSAPYGGADLGECLATARRVAGTNLSSWHDEWKATARAVAALAERELAAGRTETARLAFWRASSYFRTGGVMLMGTPPDPRLRTAYRSAADMFRRGAALLPAPPQIISIPYEATTLPGYFYSAGPGPRPAVILVGGYDGTAEELYFLNGAAALARGYHVLAFDGPGQGAALLDQGLTMRPDWENVIGPVLDDLLARPEVDPARVAVIGLSLGGYLAPRAASGEPRLAACIADCGSFDLFQAAVARLPRPLARGLPDGHVSGLLRRLLAHVARQPTGGWALRRGQLVHGAADPAAYLLALREYTLADRAASITCPVLVCQAEGDAISASAPQLAAALTGGKPTGGTELAVFTAAEGAGDHCEAGARTLFHARAFGWLDRVLGWTPS